MEIQPDALPEHLQKAVKYNIDGLDILHGELKNLMLYAEQDLTELIKEEEEGDYSDAMLSMERTRAEGVLDTLVAIYGLTYDLGQAIAHKDDN